MALAPCIAVVNCRNPGPSLLSWCEISVHRCLIHISECSRPCWSFAVCINQLRRISDLVWTRPPFLVRNLTTIFCRSHFDRFTSAGCDPHVIGTHRMHNTTDNHMRGSSVERNGVLPVLLLGLFMASVLTKQVCYVRMSGVDRPC